MSPAAEGELQYFAVRRGEVTKRADCHYHLPKYQILINKIRKCFPNLQRLDFYSEVICGPFGSAITSAEYQETGIPLIRISNITTEGTIDDKGLIFLSEKKSNSLNPTQVKPDDLVISQRGTLGIPAVIPSTYPVWNISANLIAIRRAANLDPTYIQFFLSSTLGALQLERNQSGQVQGKIITEDVASVQIPKVEFEHTLVSQMQAARKAQEQKLKEADALLDSIDGYVLAELGIQMPAVEEKKCFAVYANEIVGRRVDSYYHQSKFRTIDQIVENVRFDVFDLGVLISDISSGITPKVDEDYYTDSSGIPFLRVQNVTSQGIDLSDAKFIKREVHEGMLFRSQLKKDDLVFTITGRIGSVAVVPDNFEGNINQHSVRFHLKEQIGNIDINPHYVEAFFNSKLGRSLAIREVTGGTRPALDYKALKSLKVILPPVEAQNDIVADVKQRLAKAEALRQEAVENWEAAKTQFEAQLLSGEVS